LLTCALSREGCCLLGGHIRDVTKRLPSLVQSTDYYPLLLFLVGTNNTARSSLRSIKKDYRALGAEMRDSSSGSFSVSPPSQSKGV